MYYINYIYTVFDLHYYNIILHSEKLYNKDDSQHYLYYIQDVFLILLTTFIDVASQIRLNMPLEHREEDCLLLIFYLI